jgi:hypothetical protein
MAEAGRRSSDLASYAPRAPAVSAIPDGRSASSRWCVCQSARRRGVRARRATRIAAMGAVSRLWTVLARRAGPPARAPRRGRRWWRDGSGGLTAGTWRGCGGLLADRPPQANLPTRQSTPSSRTVMLDACGACVVRHGRAEAPQLSGMLGAPRNGPGTPHPPSGARLDPSPRSSGSGATAEPCWKRPPHNEGPLSRPGAPPSG